MTTRLDGPLKREIEIEGVAYTVTIDPAGLRLVPKGKRKGYELHWADLVSGEAALATALNASLAAAPPPPEPASKDTASKDTAKARDGQAARPKRNATRKIAADKEDARAARAGSKRKSRG